jgi:hypothetical protein
MDETNAIQRAVDLRQKLIDNNGVLTAAEYAELEALGQLPNTLNAITRSRSHTTSHRQRQRWLYEHRWHTT